VSTPEATDAGVAPVTHGEPDVERPAKKGVDQLDRLLLVDARIRTAVAANDKATAWRDKPLRN
jgi:hypothetical protein